MYNSDILPTLCSVIPRSSCPKDKLHATMKQMEETLQGYPMIVRCHRAFLVNLGQVEQIVSHSGSTQLLIKHCHESIPVSRSNMSQVKAAIKREES